MRSLLRAAVCAALPLVPALSAQDAAAPGFAAAPSPYPGAPPFGATATLSTGELVVFDGLEVFQYASDGALVVRLGALDAFGFPSFVVADPSEHVVYVGENSRGGIFRFTLGRSTGAEPIATLANDYDAAMRDDDELFVSAAACGFTCGNEIWAIDLVTNTPRLVARVHGASGPLAFDSAGNLCYGTASAAWPPPPKASAIFRWPAALIGGPTVLDLSDAQRLGGGFEGAARLAFDGRTQSLYLVENNFFSGANRVRRVLGSPEQSPVLVEGAPFRSITSLSVQPGAGPALLRAFQPESDALLSYVGSDFVAPPERVVVRPRRATASFSGPGTSGPGAFELELDGGPPNGRARILYGPSALVPPTERVLVVGGVPLFLGLDPSTQGSFVPFFTLDAEGDLSQSFVNPGGLAGQWTIQLLLFDAQNRLAGTSTAAPF